MLYLLAIILPPVAVLLCGKPIQALINLLLTLLFYVPGAVHAVLVVHDSKEEKRTRRIIHEIEKKQA
ncbi:YqaE/Pmp3 family membrane protein [bacterium]|nr:YqaE/Pmp3 family membrane protein [bacterium]